MQTGAQKARRAEIFFYEGFVSVQPSVLGAALALYRRGYEVAIYTTKPTIDVPAPNFPPEIQVCEFTPVTRWLTGPIIGLLRKLVQRRTSGNSVSVQSYDASRRARLAAKALKDALEIPQFAVYCAFRGHRADLAIAFDSTGLMAMDLGRPSIRPFVYWLLEIRLLSEADNVVARVLKRHELRRLTEADAIVVQSSERRALLEEDVDLAGATVISVPNGPSGSTKGASRRDFFTRQFDIPRASLIVLHAGMISPATCSVQLATAATSWPAEFTLVFHERTKRDPSESYIQAVRAAGGSRVVLSLTPVSFDQVGLVYGGAHIGLVCYETGEANLAKAWASSGKLPFYLHSGLPIVVVASTEPPVIADWNCGIWVREIADIGDALKTIANDYAGYSGRAKQAFAELFDFERGFDRLLAAVEIC